MDSFGLLGRHLALLQYNCNKLYYTEEIRRTSKRNQHNTSIWQICSLPKSKPKITYSSTSTCPFFEAKFNGEHGAFWVGRCCCLFRPVVFESPKFVLLIAWFSSKKGSNSWLKEELTRTLLFWCWRCMKSKSNSTARTRPYSQAKSKGDEPFLELRRSGSAR